MTRRESQFPSLNPQDADMQNHINYLKWKTQQEKRKREARTQFNAYREHNTERMWSHQQYKHSSDEHMAQLKDTLERRLSSACVCDTCQMQERRRSFTSTPSSGRSSVGSLSPTGGRHSRSSSLS